jgi:cell division transport system permease protein
MDVGDSIRPARPSPLFPRGGGEGALLGVMAIMSFLACLTLALALGAARLAQVWERGLSGQATVQIADMPGIAMEAQVAGAVEVLNGTPGIASSRVMTREESEALLRPWLGDADLSAVPVPVLISVILDPNAALDVAALREKLKAVAPGATFDDHSRWNQNLKSASAAITWTAYAVLLLIAGAASASVVFAARAALQAHREVVDVLRLTGATANFIGRQVQWRFLALGGGAGFAGLVFAILFALVLSALSPGSGAFGSLVVTWDVAVSLLAVPLVAALIAMATARFTVGRFLTETR